MNSEDINDILDEQQRELERIRRKRNGGGANVESVRKVLNVAFLLVAVVGLIIYYASPERRVTGLIVLGVGMVLKIAEFFLRFMF